MCKSVGGAEKVVDAVTVNATAVIYSQSFETKWGKYFSCTVQGTSAGGTPDYKIEWESAVRPPSTEAAANLEYVVPDGMPAITASISDELWHVLNVSPVANSYGRFKITGNAANPADSILTVFVFVQG